MLSEKIFRVVSAVEGISYLLLVLFAMPMKYMMDQPQYVRMIGMAHGVLFVVFVVALLVAAIKGRWGVMQPISFFILSMIPFGFLAIEYLLRQSHGVEQTEIDAGESTA